MSFPRRRLLRGIYGVVRRDFLIARSYRATFGLELFFGAISILVYYFISKAVGDIPSRDFQGADDYFTFASVGISIALVAQAASVGIARRVREEQLTGTLEALLAQPVGSATLSLGFTGYPFAVAMLRAGIYLAAAGWLLGADYSEADWTGALLGLVATGAALTSIGVGLGALSIVVKRAEVLSAVFVSALVLAGGAYFPVSVLPDWIEPLTTALPTRLAFDSVRDALYNGVAVSTATAGLALFAALTLPVSVWLFNRSLVVARRRGSLSQY